MLLVSVGSVLPGLVWVLPLWAVGVLCPLSALSAVLLVSSGAAGCPALGTPGPETTKEVLRNAGKGLHTKKQLEQERKMVSSPRP